MRPCGTQLRRSEQLLSILMAMFPLVCSLLSFSCLLNMMKGEPFAKRSANWEYLKVLSPWLWGGTSDCDLDKSEAWRCVHRACWEIILFLNGSRRLISNVYMRQSLWRRLDSCLFAFSWLCSHDTTWVMMWCHLEFCGGSFSRRWKMLPVCAQCSFIVAHYLLWNSNSIWRSRWKDEMSHFHCKQNWCLINGDVLAQTQILSSFQPSEKCFGNLSFDRNKLSECFGVVRCLRVIHKKTSIWSTTEEKRQTGILNLLQSISWEIQQSLCFLAANFKATSEELDAILDPNFESYFWACYAQLKNFVKFWLLEVLEKVFRILVLINVCCFF